MHIVFTECIQGRIDPPKAGRGHATLVHPVWKAKYWRLLNLNQNRTRYDNDHAL